MKKKQVISLILCAVCMYLLTASAFALETKASSQIVSYDMKIKSVTDTLGIYFNVTGTGIVNKLGCESINVYKKTGSTWIKQVSWDEDDPGMSRSNAMFYSNTMSTDCDAGVEYKIVVRIFAENDEGRDTRMQTFYVTGQ